MKTLKEIVDGAECRYLVRLMEKGISHVKAARMAGVTRTQLFRLLAKHNIPR